MSQSIAHELDRIGERVAMLTRVALALREENQALRVAVDRRDDENRLLRDRLASARERVEALIDRLPADD